MVRKPCVEVKLSLVDQTKMITDANELARNAVVYGRGSDMRWEILRRGIKMALRLAFEDKGTGIPDLGLALTDGWTSGSGMGWAFRKPACGERVRPANRRRRRHVPYQRALELAVDEIASAKLAKLNGVADDELFRLRAELQDQVQHSLMLQQELDETNRGVVALYAELDDQAAQLRTASRRSESKFQTIYAQAPSGIALLNDEGRIVDGNPALARLLTMVDVDVVGRRLSEFVPDDFAPRVDAFCSPSPLWLQGQEVPVKRPDGSMAYVEWNVSAQIEPGLTLVVATDVSQRVELEQRRLQWLERERAARGEAEQGLRMKDGFIAVLSHELRTPLNAIMGWAQVLAKHGGSDLAMRGAAAIERNCATQARMIADLLDMSRLNMGKLAMSFERVDPLREVAAAIEAMKPAIDQKSMRVELDASERYRPVRADASRFQQVVWNLLGNAIKFSVQGALITVRLVEDETGLRMRVTDSGQGIGADFLPFVFERPPVPI
jgi:PAS domain S-box-containing protein